MKRLIWILPSRIHDLILRLTGYRLVTFYPVQDNGKLRILWNKPRIIWTKNPVERGAL